jgi:hypothetical protein
LHPYLIRKKWPSHSLLFFFPGSLCSYPESTLIQREESTECTRPDGWREKQPFRDEGTYIVSKLLLYTYVYVGETRQVPSSLLSPRIAASTPLCNMSLCSYLQILSLELRSLYTGEQETNLDLKTRFEDFWYGLGPGEADYTKGKNMDSQHPITPLF